MFEGLARSRDRQARVADIEVAAQTFGLYGVASIMIELGVEPSVAITFAVAAVGVSSYRWLSRRWEALRVIEAAT